MKSKQEQEVTPGDRAITTLIFDVDDTLYDVGTGFTAHRNGYGAQQFMVDYLYFPNVECAKNVRNQYFEKYHATAKALQVAESEGAFPPVPDGVTEKKPRFDPVDLAEFWATNLNFDMLGGASTKAQLLADLKECPLTMVAFSNGPRKYVRRVLIELGIFDLFGDERLFAVEDCLPHCKPEREAFDKIFDKLGISAHECVMVEDSMKNIRRAKQLGVRTCLVTGTGRLTKTISATIINNGNNDPSSTTNNAAAEAEATKPGDAPVWNDPAVDLAIEIVEDLRKNAPGLWQTPATFP